MSRTERSPGGVREGMRGHQNEVTWMRGLVGNWD